jgi:rhomboid protease GluP
MLYLLIIVVGSFTWYVLEPDERAKVVRAVFGVFGQAKHAAGQARQRRREPDAFGTALRARSRWVLATPALTLISLFVFVSIAGGPSEAGDPGTLLEWGGNFGPLTSNGEWSRLLTSMFVHSGPLHLLINIVALVQLGLLVERLVGTYTFAAVYLISGIFASLVSLSAFPVNVSVGSSGAVSGVYGLLLATAAWGMIQRSSVSIPLKVLKDLGPVTVVFLLYNAANSGLQAGAEIGGLLTGLICGAGLSRGVAVSAPPLRRVVAATVTAMAVAAACAIPLRGISNVRPELERLVALEDQLTAAYDKAVSQFKLGAMSARQLSQLIDRTIMPELRAARARFQGLSRVPREQQSLVASAEEYLRLRDESFRLRTEALQQANMATLREADRSERASLEALEKTRAALSDDVPAEPPATR